MARFIPAAGDAGPEESYSDLVLRNFPSGCLVSFERLEDGRQIFSRLDVTVVNAVATAIAGGKTIYGDAVLFSTDEM